MSIIDKDGNEIKIDVDNPSDDKFYKVAMDSFMMFDGADFDIWHQRRMYKLSI